MHKYVLPYRNSESAKSHVVGIAIILAHRFATFFVPCCFRGNGVKRPLSPHTNFEECGIQACPATDGDEDAFPNVWDVAFADPDNDTEFVPPRVTFDTMFVSCPELHALQGIPLNILAASPGSLKALFAMEQIVSILHTMASSGVYATDAKLANFILAEVTEHDCREWPHEFGLSPGPVVKCIDGGQFVAFAGDKMIGDGVCSLFLEMKDNPAIDAAIRSDEVGARLLQDVEATLNRRRRCLMVRVDLDILTEVCLLGMATALGAPYETNKSVLKTNGRAAEIVIGN